MVNHALFSIHLACTFLLLSIAMLAADYLPFGSWLVMLIFIYGNYYFYRSLRVVYGQGRGKTALKFIIINFFLLIGMSFGLLANAMVAFLSLKG
jgi:ABC-type multidrug transport system permease subunit